MKKIAILNFKAGSGKTTTPVNLSHASALKRQNNTGIAERSCFWSRLQYWFFQPDSDCVTIEYLNEAGFTSQNHRQNS